MKYIYLSLSEFVVRIIISAKLSYGLIDNSVHLSAITLKGAPYLNILLAISFLGFIN